jgi:hypothetical protein
VQQNIDAMNNLGVRMYDGILKGGAGLLRKGKMEKHGSTRCWNESICRLWFGKKLVLEGYCHFV